MANLLRTRTDTDRLLKVTNQADNKSSPSKAKRKRKSLKPLQRSAQDENALVGNERADMKRKTGKRKLIDDVPDSPRKVQRTIFSYMSPVKIYRDANSSGENDVVENEDNSAIVQPINSEKREEKIDPEAKRLMIQTEIPVEYWKEIAQQRREALAEALDENEKLHEENGNLREKVEALKTENEALREENESLKGMAEKAEYFANVMNLIMTDEQVDGENAANSDENNDGNQS